MKIYIVLAYNATRQKEEVIKTCGSSDELATFLIACDSLKDLRIELSFVNHDSSRG